MTHRLKGVFGFLQVLLALDLQHHGPLVDGTEVGATGGGSRVNSASSTTLIIQNHHNNTVWTSGFSVTSLNAALSTCKPMCNVAHEL